MGEKLYAKAKQELLLKDPIHAKISKSDLPTLVGRGPSIMAGSWGLSEVVEEELERLSNSGLTDPALKMEQLVQKIQRGGFVRFQNGSDKSSALDLAREREKRKGIPEQLNFDPGQVSEEDRAQMLQELLKGDYVMPVSTSQERVQDLLSRHMKRNESYLPGQGKLLAEKVKNIITL